MEKSKDLVPIEDGADSTPATVQPEIKTAGKVASPEKTATATATTAEGTKGLATDAADASGPGTTLARPLPRPRARPVPKRRSSPWGWIFVLLLAAGAGAGAFFYVRSTQTNPAFLGQTTQATTRQPVTISISSNGQVQANADLGLTFGSGGTLTRLYKKLGDSVKVGDTLAQIDDSDLQYGVKSAQSSYDQQLASYNKVAEGATQKDLEQAQAAVDGAKANLTSTINGSYTAQDVASANASINSAAAKLAQTRQGGQPYEIAAAQASISSAESQLASAKANLAKVQAGPDNATVVSAQATYDQALANYDKSLSQLKLSITNAEVSRDQALNALKNAQDKYSTAFNKNHNADGSLKTALKQEDVDAETAAKRSLDDAQGTYNKSDVTLNDAKVQLDAQTRTLKSQVDNAKAQLDKTKQGPTQADIASADASVASAQSSLDNAKKTLIALTPTQAQVSQDEASLASAQASLAKLRGGTPEQVASSEATLRQQMATLEDLKRGVKPNDLAIQKAQLDVAKTSLEKAKAALSNATLKSPIAGTVVAAALTEGQTITAASVVYQIVDLSQLHVDVNVGESDISKVKEGMPVAVNLDGVPNRSFTGKVTFISSKSANNNNVISYLTTVTLDGGTTNSLLETYQSEFAKLQQNLPRAGGGTGAAGGFPGGGGGGGANLPRGASAQIAAATGICGYSLSSLFNQGGTTTVTSPKAGMTASVTFCQNLKAGVLAVPNRALKTKTENGQRVTYVDVLIDRDTNKIESRPVLTGLAGDNYTEIAGGNLKDSDLIVLSTAPSNRGTTTNVLPGGGPGGGGGGGGGFGG